MIRRNTNRTWNFKRYFTASLKLFPLSHNRTINWNRIQEGSLYLILKSIATTLQKGFECQTQKRHRYNVEPYTITVVVLPKWHLLTRIVNLLQIFNQAVSTHCIGDNKEKLSTNTSGGGGANLHMS